MFVRHIELFAGCGGLSLGLEQSGFELVLANELSPMAAESFAYNFFNENLEEIAQAGGTPQNTLWLNSNSSVLSTRLRENPFTFPPFGEEGITDIPDLTSDLEGKLVVGNIVELNRLLDSNHELVQQLRSAFGKDGGLDLVSGGPPCQSFSMAGLRKRDCEKNTLPWEFAKFVRHSQPKVAMLENVTGILRAFKDDNGNKFHAWYEVAKAFASIEYVPLCLHINARFAGIPQNRPRFIMIAIRHDYYQTIADHFHINSAEAQLFNPSLEFYNLVQRQGDNIQFGHLDYFDASKPFHRQLFENSFLQPLVNGDVVTVSDALDDLKQNAPSKPSEFIMNLNNTFVNLPQRNKLLNHVFRNNGEVVRRRFRVYQILQRINERYITKAIFSVLKGEAIELADDVWDVCREYEYLQHNGGLQCFATKDDFVKYLRAHPTKKQTQKALNGDSQAPAALSIPDDACHYDEHELRVLTVREMARIQSFPDDFEFKGKYTTGGKERTKECPRYTQVGNAVPPLLAEAIGLMLEELNNEHI